MPPRNDAQFPSHGGDLTYAKARYGHPQIGWLDLSTGINPEPYPLPPIAAETFAALPQSEAHEALIEAARTAYGLSTNARLMAVPGSEVALRLLPVIAPAGPVAIVGPTYGSHRDTWTAAGRSTVEITSTNDMPPEAAILVLVNPNNPDGRTIARPDLADIAERLTAKNGLLVIDEAFCDLAPEASLAPSLDNLPAVVLRSFGKFYGLPGLRLGFVAGPARIVDRLRQLLGDWPVSSAALVIGRAALSDRDWQISARGALSARAEKLRSLLRRHGLRVAGGTDLFVLIQLPDAAPIHTQLAEAGIWTRTFSYRRDWLRIGLPRTDLDFARLDTALGAIMTPLRSRSTG